MLVLVSYSVCRLEFLLENWSLFSPDLTWGVTFDLFRGGMLFDGAALAYTNLLYVVLALFPLHWKERPVYHTCLKVLFVCINALAIGYDRADIINEAELIRHNPEKLSHAVMKIIYEMTGR